MYTKKKENKIRKLLGVLFALILSILFIPSLIFATLYTTTRSIISPESISGIITSTTYDGYDSLSTAVDKIAEKSDSKNTGKKLADDIVNSEPFHEILDIYISDTVKAVSGSLKEEEFTKERINEILRSNEHTFKEIISKHYPEMTEEDIQASISYINEDLSQDISDILPKPSTIADAMPELKSIPAVEYALSVSAIILLWSVVIVIAILILICRSYNLKGLTWIGACTVLAGLLNIAAAKFTESLLQNMVIGSVRIPFAYQLIETLSARIMLASSILLLFGAAFIIIYIISGKMRKKKLLRNAVNDGQ